MRSFTLSFFSFSCTKTQNSSDKGWFCYTNGTWQVLPFQRQWWNTIVLSWPKFQVPICFSILRRVVSSTYIYKLVQSHVCESYSLWNQTFKYLTLSVEKCFTLSVKRNSQMFFSLKTYHSQSCVWSTLEIFTWKMQLFLLQWDRLTR